MTKTVRCNILVLICIVFSIGCGKPRFLNASRQMESMRNYSHYRSYAPYFGAVHKALVKSGKLNFLNTEHDTLFIVEGFATEESPLMFGSLWNRKGQVHYTYIFGHLSDDDRFRLDSGVMRTLLADSSLSAAFGSLSERVTKNRYFFNKVIFSKNTTRVIVNESVAY